MHLCVSVLAWRRTRHQTRGFTVRLQQRQNTSRSLHIHLMNAVIQTKTTNIRARRIIYFSHMPAMRARTKLEVLQKRLEKCHC